MSDLVNSSFNYSRTRLLGSGCFGKVYLIDDRQLNGNFAAKEIPISSFTRPDDLSELFSEAAAMNAAKCQNVIQINSAGRNTDSVVIVMPLYEKGSLSSKIAGGPLSPNAVIRLGQDILNGLYAIHCAQHIHFDIKPSNILFDNTGQAVVSDFGQSQRIQRFGHANAPGMYTWAMPPEAIDDFSATILVDIYQAGVTLYRAVNGDEWYQAQQRLYPMVTSTDEQRLHIAIRRGTFPDRKKFMPHVAEGLRRVLRKAMNAEPSKRYQTATEFADALSRVKCDHNWSVTTDLNKLTWSSVRETHCPLHVELRTEGTKFTTCVFKISNEGKPRFEKGKSGKTFLTKEDAFSYLENNVFEVA